MNGASCSDDHDNKTQEQPQIMCSSFIDYIASASKLMESNPSLVNSVMGLGPLEDDEFPKPKTFSGFNDSDIIEDYEGETIDQLDWFNDLLQGITGWLYSTQASKDLSHQDLSNSKLIESTNDLENSLLNESFWKEWEWVLSRTEELAIQQSSKRREQIDNELKQIRQTATHLQQRPYFVKKAQSILSCGSLKDSNPEFNEIFNQKQIHLLETVPLLASERSKLLRDIINQFSDEWLSFIGQTIFPAKNQVIQQDKPTTDTTESIDINQTTEHSTYSTFIENYTETQYSKNITGALVSMGFLASHGSGEVLTAQVLGDILWSWWTTLRKSIEEIVSYEISANVLEMLAKEIIKAGPVIARVWYETVCNSQKATEVSGILPEKWRQNESAETQRLNQLRAVGLVDARFRDGPSTKGAKRSTMTPDRLALVKQKLEECFLS